MNKETPLTAIGDEAIEARIVAWVLGEASAFEIAELERLCGERPELMIFQRRMKALHGLIGEAGETQLDAAWKLPPAKRVAVLDQIDPNSALPETFKDSRVRRSAMRSFLSIAACVIFTVILLGLTAPMVIRQRKKAPVAAERSMAMQRELAALEEQELGSVAYKEMKSLRTELPPELIEGTPRPIVLPGQAVSNEMAQAKVPLPEEANKILNSPFTASSAQSLSARAADNDAISGPPSTDAFASVERKVQTSVEKKPSTPSSSMAQVIASSGSVTSGSVTAIPMPEVAVDTPSLEFGDGSDFGGGWGDASGGSGGGFSGKAIAQGNRSGDGDVTRESIDHVLSDPRRGGLKKDLSTFMEGEATADPYWDTSGVAKNGRKSGVEYEIHTGYKSEYLFRGNDLGKDLGQAKESASPAPTDPASTLPQITTRSLLSTDEAVAEAQTLRKQGKYDEARSTLEGALASAPGDPKLGKELDYLDDPIRTNPALTYEHTRDVDKVRRGLYSAEGNYNLGKYDDAKREYEDVLRKDPSNPAARRGMEKIAQVRSDYYTAAYDHTRSELLAQVDKSWEQEVPVENKEKERTGWWVGDESLKAERGEGKTLQPHSWLGAWSNYSDNSSAEGQKNFDGIVNYGSPILADESEKGVTTDHIIGFAGIVQDDPFLEGSTPSQAAKNVENLPSIRGMIVDRRESESSSNLAEKEMIRRQSTLAESERLLTEARKAYAAGDYQKAYDTYEKSLSLIPDVASNPALKERRDFLCKSLGDAAVALSIHAKKVGQYEGAKQWLNKAREWDPSNAQASKELAADVSAEITAAEDPYSTFSLNISDASFRIAQAAMAKGERPDPAGVKVEQFYNAVDYGDPAPGAGEPVACFIEQAAHPVIPGRNLVRVALKTAAVGRSAAQPLRLTLLVDQSGSMSRADRREAMDTAMRSLGTLLTDKDLVTVIGFSRKPSLLADGMKGDEVGKKLAGLVNQSASEGGTNLEEAIKLAEQKALSRKLVGAQNRIVLFTDGAANLGDADPLRLAAKVEQLRQQGIAFDIAGIAADDLNDELLAELARKGNGRYSVVGKGEEKDFAKQLAGAFRPAAENVKVQVRFNPERVARYKLIGFEKDRLKTEDFRNDAVDAAELAAEEAGVAIYQVEPLPDGRGEIGEVSVRFRDTASGTMVERMWTMTHDPATPTADRAAPSMQLALLAMLAGEKLKGGPLAEAIDFQQFAEPQATVKQAFGQDARVAEMLRMVDALK